MSFLANLFDRFFPSRRTGTVTCQCGSIQVELNVPSSSYMLLEQTTALCHCTDCVGFCKQLRNGATVLDEHTESSQLVQFYKSDITVVKGQESIQAVRLYQNSPMARCYCKNCQTPLGADITVAPVTLLYHKLLQKGRFTVTFLPHVVVNYAGADRKWVQYDRHTVVRQHLFCPWFFLRVVARALLGFLLNKGNGGLLSNNNYEGVPVRALETIGKVDETRKEQ